MKKTVAVIYGGNSSEAEVSIKSGKHVLEHLDTELFLPIEVFIKGMSWVVKLTEDKEVEIDKSDFSYTDLKGNIVRFDKALIMIHGTPGEDGLLQAYFDMVGVEYSTCSAGVSAITFNKYACKCYLRDTKIDMPKEVVVKKGDHYDPHSIIEKLGLPVFVKPNLGGSSFGISKVKREEDLTNAVDTAFGESDQVLIEEFISGREMTNGAFLTDKGIFTLPVTEIISEKEFFDYEAKYLGASKEVCPANITKELRDKIQNKTEEIYKYLGCKGIVRIDYIVRGEDIYFLEINTVPGMTKMSLVPQQVREAGLTIKDFLTNLINH